MAPPMYTADVKTEVAIRKGEGEYYNLKELTILESFDNTVKKFGDKPAIHQKVLKEVRT